MSVAGKKRLRDDPSVGRELLGRIMAQADKALDQMVERFLDVEKDIFYPSPNYRHPLGDYISCTLKTLGVIYTNDQIPEMANSNMIVKLTKRFKSLGIPIVYVEKNEFIHEPSIVIYFKDLEALHKNE